MDKICRPDNGGPKRMAIHVHIINGQSRIRWSEDLIPEQDVSEPMCLRTRLTQVGMMFMHILQASTFTLGGTWAAQMHLHNLDKLEPFEDPDAAAGEC